MSREANSLQKQLQSHFDLALFIWNLMNLFVRDRMRKVSPLCFSIVCAEEDFALRFKFRLTCTSNPTQTMLYASSHVRLLCSESVELAVVALSYPSAFTVLRLVRRLPALAVTRSTCMSLHMQLLRRRRRSQAYQTIMRSHLAARVLC